MPLLPDDLDQHPLPTPAVKFAVEDPLPGAKVESAIGHRDHNLAAHHAQHCELRSASCARRKPDGLLAPLGRIFKGIDHIFRFIHKSPHL